jgi:uncharacterized protein (DUF1800 family)
VDWSAIVRLRGKPKGSVIHSLLHTDVQRPLPPPRMTSWNQLDKLNKSSYQSQKKARAIARREGIALKLWWINHMRKTSTPLFERMTLFWHNHFTSSIDKVLQPSLLYIQNKTLRQHALGNFGDLLRAMIKDPAMLVYLDGMMNQKSKINENFAREFLELFTLGQGYFSEADMSAASHAFTGWGVDRFNAKAVYSETNHSQQQQKFLGKTGVFSSDDIINIILQQPRTAEYITEKFWKEFISLTPPKHAVIRQWAAQFRNANYDIKILLSSILNSSEFWSIENRGQRIKSPVELLIGTSRMLGYSPLSDKELINTFRTLGQSLFDPPNVAGWKGGKTWINTESLLVRNAFLQKFRHNSSQKAIRHMIPSVSQAILVQWVLPIDPVMSLLKTNDKTQFIQALLLDPSYQLT